MIQETGNRLITALQKQTEKIIYFCSAENISPNLSIHEIRKSYKRLWALLHFYCDCGQGGTEETRKGIRASGKGLAPVRESFIDIQYFDKLTSRTCFISDKKIKQVKELLAERNRVLIDEAFLSSETIPQIVAFIKQFQIELDTLRVDCPSMLQLKEQVLLTFTSATELYQTIEPEFLPDVMHELRKMLKRLWYQLDFLKFLHPRYFKMKSAQLNKITEQLGVDHDLFVFGEDLKDKNLDFTEEELNILENQIQHQRELNRLKLLPRLKQFFNESPEVFDYKMDKIFKLN